MTVHQIASHPRFVGNLVNRRQLETVIGYRKSKIAQFNAEGMPHVKQSGRNMYYPPHVIRWLQENGYWRECGYPVSIDDGHNTPTQGGIYGS